MKFIEAEKIQAINGLSPDDRSMPGIAEMVDLAVVSNKRFKEACGSGRGVKQWLASARAACGTLREANSETTLGFLLRKGIQTVANDWYKTIDTKWREYCEVTGSTTLAEWYAPLYPSVIAGEVQRGQPFPEGKIVGEDSNLVNKKFGLVESFERELFDDDQTGQINKRASYLGTGMAITEGIYAAFKFIGSARTYANLSVPASSYSTTDYTGAAVTSPWSTGLYASSSGNRPSSYGALNVGHFKTAYKQCLQATDPNSNKLVVDVNCLLYSTQDVFNADILLAPGLYPGVVGQSDVSAATNAVLGGTVSATGANQGVLAGFPGGIGSPNPFASMGIKKVMERYLPDWAWAVGQRNRGIVFQERDPLEVVQETPNSGFSFAFDVIRYRSRRRFQVDWVGGGSRFWYLGSDGTVTGVQ